MIAEPNKDPHFRDREREERESTKANALGKEGIYFLIYLCLII